MTLYEQETYINYNMEEKTATCSTFDRHLIARLDAMCGQSQDIRCVKRTDEGYAEYELPKKWVKIRMPRILSDEERAAMVERGRALYAAQKAKKADEDDDEEETDES